MDDEAATVRQVVTDLYLAYLDGDRPRLEAHLDESCTLWETVTPELRSKAELQAARRQRRPDEPQPVQLLPTDLQIRIWGDTACETHELRAIFADAGQNQLLRCSSVLRRIDGRWLIVHHHEERLSSPSEPV